MKYHKKMTELESKKRLSECFKLPSKETKEAKEKYHREMIKYVREMWKSQEEYRYSRIKDKFESGR